MTNDCDNLRDFLERFATDREALRRALPPSFSPAYDARLCAFYDEWQAALDALDFDALPSDAQADAALFGNLLDKERDALRQNEAGRAETEDLLPFAPDIVSLDAALRNMERPDPADAAQRLEAIRADLAAHTKALAASDSQSTIRPVTAERAARTTLACKTALLNWFAFYDGYDPQFSWWVREPYKVVDKALDDYAAALRQTFAPNEDAETEPAAHIVGDPIGEAALIDALRRELIPYSPDELIAIGEREAAWCTAEMEKAAHEMGLNGDIKAALEAVKKLHVAPGEQPGLVRDLACEAVEFVDARDLVTVPPLAREIWRMRMMSPESQKINPFFLGGEVIQVSFPTDTMTQSEKQMSLRGNNRYFARATVQHELIPGHHLQLFMMARYRTHRKIFQTPFYIEGWAIHWEFLLWKLQFARTPEEKIGMLFWRMHRCVRVVFSLRYHLGQIGASDCVKMLIDRVGHEPENALAEVRRSLGDAYPPLYQAAYLLGGLQMHALYRECVENGTMTPRAFHDAVLQRGAIPIPVLRAELTNQPIPKNLAELQWRF